ncbi:MAG: alanine racemase [Lachnospiraceae bacterium]|nr:alanine racemase [Lachnospiraceae bacterium]
MMQRAAWAEVNTKGIAYNLGVIRSQLKDNVKVCAVVKADAYGHGLVGFVRELARQGFADMAAVGKFREMMQLSTECGVDKLEILLLGVATPEEIAMAVDCGRIIPRRSIFSIYNIAMLRALDKVAETAKVTLRVHIRIDGWNSGMGLSMEEFKEHEEEIFNMKHLEVCGLYSHLYTAYSDDREEVEGELKRFDSFVNSIPQGYRRRLTVHILNSALIFHFPEYSYDMVRAGTSMYGLPCGDNGRLVPIMRICAQIFDVRDVPDSVPLSYLQTGEATDGGKRRIARIMLGYWDSPLLLTQENIRISIRGKLYAPADEVCMDNLCVDITGADDIEVGDIAYLMGENGVTINEILERNRIDYVHSEWMCLTAGRLEKVYL